MQITEVKTGAILTLTESILEFIAATIAPFLYSRWVTPSMGLAVGDKFPTKAAKAWGVSGKKAVVYFYGADGAPSCTKQAKAFDAASLDATVVGVRSDEGVKEGFSDEYGGVKFVVDEGNEVREEVGIAKDLFGFLPGRETYVLDKSGEFESG